MPTEWELIKEARSVGEGKLPADPLALVAQLGEALDRASRHGDAKHNEVLRVTEEKHQQEARAKAAEEKLKASGEHCATCICGRRAPVQASPAYEGKPAKGAGTIAWEEHLLAWTDYARRYGNGQTAERMAQRGGFSYWEVADHLGHDPTTWKPR